MRALLLLLLLLFLVILWPSLGIPPVPLPSVGALVYRPLAAVLLLLLILVLLGYL